MTAPDSRPPAPTSAGDAWVEKQSGWARILERLALLVERPVNRLSGTTQLNPFYHTGTIAVFLLLVVGLTGFYLFLFYQYGLDRSYSAVVRLEGQFIARFMRALHRYASGAAVITILLHAYRMLFMERLRGARWLAWVTGIVLTLLVWSAGVTGYWLLADTRAQLLTEGLIRFLALTGDAAPRLVAALVAGEDAGQNWQLFLLLMAAHVLAYLATVFFFWLHLRRLARARWFPDPVWIMGMSIVLVIGAALFPLGVLAQADPTRVPGTVVFDPIFLFFLPLRDAAWAPLFWGGLLALTAFSTALPWLTGRRKPTPPPVRILDDSCTGCTRCAIDCPYKAIHMVENPPQEAHKFLAVADPGLCVSCGICIGSCTDLAITLGEAPPDYLWRATDTRLALLADDPAPRLVYACERHINQAGVAAAPGVVPVPCAGALPPDLLIYALDAGAAEVRVVGCPPSDCAQRDGNLLAEGRLVRERPPRLKKRYAQVPITAVWESPDRYRAAVAQRFAADETNWLESRRLLRLLTWKNVLPAFVLLSLVLIVQVVFTDLPFAGDRDRPAELQVILSDLAAPIGFSGSAAPLPEEMVLTLRVDGETLLRSAYAPAALRALDADPFFFTRALPAGVYPVTLTFATPAEDIRLILFDGVIALGPGEVVRLSYDPGRSTLCRGAACMR